MIGVAKADASTIANRNQVDENQDASVSNQGPLGQWQMSENDSSANVEKTQVMFPYSFQSCYP